MIFWGSITDKKIDWRTSPKRNCGLTLSKPFTNLSSESTFIDFFKAKHHFLLLLGRAHNFSLSARTWLLFIHWRLDLMRFTSVWSICQYSSIWKFERFVGRVCCGEVVCVWPSCSVVCMVTNCDPRPNGAGRSSHCGWRFTSFLAWPFGLIRCCEISPRRLQWGAVVPKSTSKWPE